MLNIFARLAPLVLLAVLAFLAATTRLFSPSPVIIGTQILAAGLVLWARASFPAGGFRFDAAPGAARIVRGGPYRFLRHPIYSAALLFTWAAVLSHRSATTLLLGLLVTGVLALRVLVEEQLLRARYPEYAAYARTTRALVPFLL